MGRAGPGVGSGPQLVSFRFLSDDPPAASCASRGPRAPLPYKGAPGPRCLQEGAARAGPGAAAWPGLAREPHSCGGAVQSSAPFFPSFKQQLQESGISQ